ncbi:PWWP domain-containing protein 2A isoform X2 [Brachyhypopomus gauderio]|uniref:PWWP domain-containing protein 2A isoform X2 n=1 Tax=Brachyhypopomus gauderio TaxID=698409 RepID=UPI00404351E2
MAAVAAEPGAAAASTTAGDGVEYEPEPAEHVADLEAHSTQDLVPEMDLCHQPEDVDAAQECGQVQMEIRRPDLHAAGKALSVPAEDGHAETGGPRSCADTSGRPVFTDYTYKDTGVVDERLKEPFLSDVEAAKEVGPHEPNACLVPTSVSDPQPSVVFLHSLPARPGKTEPGVSISETAEPAVEYYDNPETRHPADVDRDFIGFTGPHQTHLEPEAASEAPLSELKDVLHRRPQPPDRLESPSISEETSLGESVGQSCISDFSNTSSKDSPEPPAALDRSLVSSESEDVRAHTVLGFRTDLRDPGPGPESKPQLPCADAVEGDPETIEGLVAGSEVRVSLDHIIDDALVVSFRLGEKIFSGVLMDLSKRFGPYGIPITVFPKREYQDKPESMQLKVEAFQSETEKGVAQGPSDALPNEPAQAPSAPQPTPNSQPNPWTSKPPPLFQEGAPYPPPLFIRDTYNQSLPQPLPRKIKRPKRRLYREEPTSIMNAIKLRPRQVLCDKCKGAVVQGDKRETRRGPMSDCRNDDAKRRRGDGAATASGKRPRGDVRSEDRGRAADGPKRQASTIRVASSSSSSASSALTQVKGGAAAGGSRVVRGVSAAVPSAATGASRVQLNAKKVLQSKNVDHSKAREVLKMAKAQRRQTVTAAGSGNNTKAMTRAAALQEAHQKVHFTRRLQQISGGGPGMSNPLPPRMRIKPQRYRNEENDSSSCKPPCLEKVPGGGRLALPKLAAPRCTSARSPASPCPAGQAATAAAEPQGPDAEPESPLSQAQPQPQPHPHSAPEHRDPQLEPEELEGRETRAGKAGNLVVYMTLNPSQPDSSSTSVCSVDSADDLKSSNSECSSTETLDFPPPALQH